MTRIINLCNDGCCPVIEIDEHEVRIGEEGNLCTLSRDEWNTLVSKIKNDEV
ncbi:MAG: hypothetical protein QF415_14275 [Candidatus Undinarchaeales archaeon]|jgi:hypothetical protein|nr:hypothetical protein [Candidatus Undinarchaeales archaeon]MDP7492552.1 hypothetical protein [Candidatus Undinarchaeales archaeon]